MQFDEQAAASAAPKSDYSSYSLQTSQEAFVQGAKWMFDIMNAVNQEVPITDATKELIYFDMKTFLTNGDFQALQALAGTRNTSLINKVYNFHNYVLGILNRNKEKFRLIK